MLTGTMIVGLLSDPVLRSALLDAAHPEEDVFLEADACVQALEHGFPRVVVAGGGDGTSSAALRQWGGLIPVVALDGATLRRWEAERRAAPVPPPRVAHATSRLRGVLSTLPRGVTWVDRALSDLERASGARLPLALRGFARRVLESPSWYGDLHPMAEVAHLSRGALKARFRRRNLASPYGYLRWFRVMAAAHVLSDPGVTTLEAAYRLGFGSAGNLCRAVQGVSGLTPTEVRTPQGWNRLVTTFARGYLDPVSLTGWLDLDDLFLRGVA